MKKYITHLTSWFKSNWMHLFYVGVILFMFGQNIQTRQHLEQSLDLRDAVITEQLLRIQSSAVTNRTLETELQEKVKDNLALQEDIKKLKAKLKSISSVTMTTPGEIIIVKGSFPEEHLYKMQSGMPVAKHKYIDDTFTAETYDLTIDVNVITSETRTGQPVTHIDSSIKSTGDSNSYPIKTEATFQYVKQKQKIQMDTDLNLGLTVPVPTLHPRASIGVSLLSIGSSAKDNSLRFVNPNIQLAQSIGLGVDLIGLNIGAITNTQLIQDTWIWLGASTELAPKPLANAINISITSTL